jgi:AraC-like DNA-binding protein
MRAFDLSTSPDNASGVRLVALSDAPPCDGVSDTPNVHVLGVHLGKSARVRQERGGERFEGLYRHGDLTTIPAGCPATCWTRSESSFLHVHLSRSFLERAVERVNHDVPLRFRFGDPVCRELLPAMLEQARERGSEARLYLESAAVVVAHRLLALAPTGAPRGRMSRASLERVLDFMQASLSETPGVLALAELVGMSPAHFSRSFKAATGEAPHRYLNRLRLERAKQLLADSSLRVVDIGLALGFANPSHFAAFFRAGTGMSPARFRKQLH